MSTLATSDTTMTNEKSCKCWQEIKWLKSAVERLQLKVELQHQLILEIKDNSTTNQFPLIRTFSNLSQPNMFNNQNQNSGTTNVIEDCQSISKPIISPDQIFTPDHSSAGTNPTKYENELIVFPEIKTTEKENYDELACKENKVQLTPKTIICTTKDSSKTDSSHSQATSKDVNSTGNFQTKLQLATKLAQKYNTSQKPILQCSHCDNVYTSKHGLDTHVNVVHKNIQYTCRHCSASFRTNSGLRYHVKMHARKDGLGGQLFTEKLIVCQFCGDNFNQLQGLRLHLSRMHSEQTNITCNLCKKTFPRKKYCNRHVLKCGFR